MDKTAIQAQAQRVKHARFRLAAEEQRLGLQIWKQLKPRGSLRDLAKELGISAQYLCDISHGRRKISEAVVEKVMGL
jgi:hypothetical protein